MNDYDVAFDAAQTSTGPWLHFYAKASQDGIPAGSWALRDSNNTTVLDLSKGFVLDWPAVRTGWVQALGISGVAPVKQWNASRARFEPRPPGDKWAKGFLAPLAYASDAAAIWEQWGAGVWIGFSEMFMELMTSAPAHLPSLPLLIPVSARPMKFAQGPTLVPKLQLSRYVPRPACLPEGDASPTEIATQPQARPQVTYSYPPTQTARPAPAQPSTPPRPAPVQPAGWDEPVVRQDLAPTGTVNSGGKVVPIPGQAQPSQVTLLDDEVPF
jgi:hypothetical protein